MELKLAKKFFKGQRAYGAESFIQGFSGHVIEILTLHYGSFEKLIKAASKWNQGEVIDTEKHYENPKEVLEELNKEKMKSPLIVIDPVEGTRNAAASLRVGVFSRLVKGCVNFLEKPSVDAFVEKSVELKGLKKRESPKQKLVAFSAKPEKGKIDVVGAQLKKQYEHILRFFNENEFTIVNSNWYWDKKSDAIFYFFVDPKELSKKKLVQGPLTYGPAEHILAFKHKYARRGVYRQGYNYYVEVPRELKKVVNVVNAIKNNAEFSNLNSL